jgi:hypothetical protein
MKISFTMKDMKDTKETARDYWTQMGAEKMMSSCICHLGESRDSAMIFDADCRG